MQLITSAKTSRNIVPALHKALIKYSEFDLVNPPTCFDIGGGKFEKATSFLFSKGVVCYSYDPFNRSEFHNKRFFHLLEICEQAKRDCVALCSNALCVIKNIEDRKNVIKLCSRFPVAYFTVYEGDKSGIGKSTRDGWQENRKLETYIDEILIFFDNVKIKKLGNTKIIVASK